MEENEEFEVHKIVSQRENHGCIEYKIRWKNYGPDFDTWEPESNLIGCDQVLKNFKIQNSMESFTIKEDVEDGEVSGSDSSERSISRRSKKSKKKKSKRRSYRSPTDPCLITQSVNDNFGIKVEIAVDNQLKERPAQTIFSTNFSLGASELLYGFCGMPMNFGSHVTEPNPICKEELSTTNQEEIVVVKEEKRFLEERIECDVSDSDSDLDGQLKVVTNDEVCPPPVEQMAPPALSKSHDPIVDVQSEQNRSWRDNHTSFKIRKSQRSRDDQSHATVVEDTPIIFARDRWPVKVKDSQTEAFYSLPLVSSLAEARQRVDKENAIMRATVTDKEALFRAVEEGNSVVVWSAYLLGNEDSETNVGNGDLLISAARFGYSDIVGIILKAGADVNYQNEEGVTALMAASEFGHESSCQLLIDNGAFINTVNKKQESAIIKAVSRGNTDCLLVLLQHGCDVFGLDNDKGPLQLARLRNLHEMEILIAEYAQRLSESLTQQFVALTNECINVNYILFPLRVVSTFESDEFAFEFSAKIPPVRDDECNLLAIFSGFVQDRQLKYCLDKESNVKCVAINDIEQQSLFPNGNCSITTMAPILDGKNVLNIKCNSRINCRWVRMLIIGFRIKIIEKQPV